ncbi:uncharacterized protein [Physcomitrium patens]|uniref:uncharacterized protein isoform X2 n=1 Tax=Physcomitrium patens TaxID=3218 RepID=UPI003CCDF18B
MDSMEVAILSKMNNWFQVEEPQKWLSQLHWRKRACRLKLRTGIDDIVNGIKKKTDSGASSKKSVTSSGEGLNIEKLNPKVFHVRQLHVIWRLTFRMGFWMRMRRTVFEDLCS